MYHLRLQATYEESDTVIELRERIHKIRYTVWKIIRDHKIRRRISKRDQQTEMELLQKVKSSEKGESQ